MWIQAKKWAIVALLVGVALGFGLRFWTEPAPAPAHGADVEYYQCEVHGHIHEGPGTCPVCGTPLVKVPDMPRDGTSKASSSERSPQADARPIKYWRSPMDPTFVSKSPGKDNMGMDLVAVYEGDADATPGVIKIDPRVTLQMGVRTAVITHGPLERRIRAVGTVTFNEETLGTVTSKLAGWVDKLYVNKTGETVKIGDPLFEIYAKELVEAQVAFIASLSDARLTSKTISERERSMAEDLLASVRRRLELWDIPDALIDEIAKERKARRTLLVRSPFNGVVTHKSAVEGRFFAAGTPLFEIADLSTVWVNAKIYEFERPWVKVGQTARIQLAYIPGKVFEGVVEFVYPYLNEKTRDITLRLRFPNPDRALLPGMFANVIMDCSLGTHALLVPEEAVLDTGTRKVVFVMTGPGTFEAHNVSLGVRTGQGTWEVLDGLKDGDRVVTSGQFMLDAESKVREAVQKFLAGGKQEAPREAEDGDGDPDAGSGHAGR